MMCKMYSKTNVSDQYRNAIAETINENMTRIQDKTNTVNAV